MSRIVLNTFGSLGDLHPFLAVGIALAARGHDVVLATHAEYRARVESAGLRFHAVPPALGDFRDVPGLFRAAMHPSDGSRFVLREMCLPYVHQATLCMLEAAERADLVVSHSLAFGAVIAAEALRIPRAHVVLQPLVMFSSLDPPMAFGMPPLERLLGRGARRWRTGYAIARAVSRGWFGIVDETRASLALPREHRHPLFDMASPTLNLALFSGVLMSPQADWPPRTLTTGFAVHDRGENGEGAPAALAAFLDAGTPPLVFTLGSSAVLDAGSFYQESLAAARALGMRALLLCGPEERNRPAALAGGDAIAVDYAPHSEVFPRAAAIVHQGGIGTTGQALAAGRPMLVMPCSHDQPDNAARCRRLGVARIVARKDYRAPRVAAELRTLLADATAARCARETGARVRAEDGAAAAAIALELACADRSRGA